MLQREALEIATVKLPERVAAAASGAELAESDPAAFNRVEPIGVQTTDEIGRVARAFDQVHAEAVRLAGTEAQLRSNLNAMFISLSRRSVPLIDRLSRMIDSFEQNEDDPDQLAHLFSMDHLVTRMRRNSENLLVLAGEEPVRKWSEPVPLTDVTRAAAAEIEQYGRVALTVQPGIMVSGQAAADVVHLLAELIENATLFSPRNTQVQVAAADAPGGGVVIEILDEGVGVSAGRLAEMNWRLDHPPGVDVSVSRHMGLFAVSRLAARRGIRVRLRAGAPQGLTALVWLPGTLISHEQPQTVGMHSRQPVEGVALADDMIFAEALPAGGDPLQRTSSRHGGRHRLGLLASAGPEEALPAGRGYAAESGGYAAAENGHAAAGNGHAADDGGSAPLATATPPLTTGTPPTAVIQPRATGGPWPVTGGPQRVSSGSSGPCGSRPRHRRPPPPRPGAALTSNHRRRRETAGGRPTLTGAPRAGWRPARTTPGRTRPSWPHGRRATVRTASRHRSRRPGPGCRSGCRRRTPGAVGQPAALRRIARGRVGPRRAAGNRRARQDRSPFSATGRATPGHPAGAAPTVTGGGAQPRGRVPARQPRRRAGRPTGAGRPSPE